MASLSCTCSRHSVCPVHLGMVPVEAWRVVDRWWTDAPVVTNYRVLHREGRLVTERANGEEEPLLWEVVPNV